MTKRSVVVELMARVGQYVSGMGAAAASTDKAARAASEAGRAQEKAAQKASSASKTTAAAAAAAAKASEDAAKRTESSLDQVGKSVKNNRASWDQAGASSVAFGAAAVGALGLAAKAAMDWESAWAGVNKTVDGTPEQMAELEGGLRGLAKTLPATHGELAAVAEAAGQLGVARKDILGFTKTMVDLGESTNLTADEAATQIAQISNVMGTMEREGSEGVARFGSALVALGNAGASTESEILAMAQRISGAGAIIGASESEVLALSNTLASMGVKAELGGGVTTRVLLKMYSAVKSGGGALDAFAKTAGVSAAEFSRAFGESPVQALSMVTEGLGQVKDEGGNVVQTMLDMGIKGTENVQVMLALAASGDMLSDSLTLGATSWEENTALIEEASKRYETTESKVKIAWNGIKDAAIDAGAVVLPVIVEVADTVGKLASSFGDLPAPVQGALVGLTGVAGVSALVAGGLLLIVPKVMDTIGAFRTLREDMPKLSKGLGGVAKVAGVTAAAFVGFEILKTVHNDAQPATASLEDMTQALIGLNKQSGSIDDVFAGIGAGSGGDILKNVTSVGDALAELNSTDITSNISSFGSTVLGIDNDTAKLSATVATLDKSIAGAASAGNFELAAKGFKAVADSAKEQGVSLEDVATRFPAYMEALKASASAAGVHVEDQEMLNWALGKTPAVMEEAAAAAEKEAGAIDKAAASAEAATVISEEIAEALKEIGVSAEGTVTNLTLFTEALQNAGLLQLSSRDAARGYQESIDAIDSSLKGIIEEHGGLADILNATATGFNNTTPAGRDAEAAFDAVASSGARLTQAMAESGESQATVQSSLKGTYDSLIVAAGQMGITGEAADLLARDVMGIPPEANIDTWMSDAARGMAEETTGAIIDIPDQATINSWMDGAAKEMADATAGAAKNIPNEETIHSWMSNAAFLEALRTRAAALGIPEQEVIDSFMSSAARDEADATTARVLGIPPGVSISAYMSNMARIEADATKAAIDAIPSYKESKIVIVTEKNELVRTGQVGRNASGGRIPRHATGGKLPSTGPGTERTDGILGISSLTGQPMSWLDGGEWIVNAKSSDKHHNLIGAINRDDPRLASLPALAGGARLSREYAPVANYPGAAPADSGPMQMVGTLTMDSGEVLGTFRGIAVAAAKGEIHQQSSRAATYRRG